MFILFFVFDLVRLMKCFVLMLFMNNEVFIYEYMGYRIVIVWFIIINYIDVF